MPHDVHAMYDEKASAIRRDSAHPWRMRAAASTTLKQLRNTLSRLHCVL